MKTTTERPTVLVVDDVMGNIMTLAEILSDDYKISMATSGVAALEIARSKHPDLILLDIMMPDMDGYAVCKSLMADDDTREIPIIFVTGANDLEHETASFNVGAVDFIAKPVNPELVKLRVRTHLRLKQKTDQLKALSLERQKTAQAVIKNTLDGILIVDLAGRIVDVNPAGEALLASQKDDILGANVGIFILAPELAQPDLTTQQFHAAKTQEQYQVELPDYQPLSPEIMQEFLDLGQHSECLCRQANGSQRVVEVGLAGIKIDDQQHYAAFLHDITSLKDLLVAANAASAAKTSFLAAMSHEIRTPMNAILGMTELLNRTSLNKKQEGYVQAVLSSGTHLLELINDILDFSKIEAGGLTLENIDFDLDAMLENLTVTFSTLATKKGISCTLEEQPNWPNLLIGDVHRLRQVLTNLLGNALKFTSEGHVALKTKCHALESGRVEVFFAVRDSGIGMTRESMTNLFTAFTQADQSTSRKFGGTGLGLHISQQLVELMGSNIRVESAPGRGSTFFFDVVLESGPDKQSSSCESVADTAVTEQQLQQIRGARVLLVEDNELNQQVAQEMLCQVGLFVELAADGQEAIAWMEREDANFDLVLMDIQMPRVNGFDATRAIRLLSRWQKIPIIALTAHATFVERDRTMAAGMNDFLSKPFRPEWLEAILVKWISPGERDIQGLPVSKTEGEDELADFPTDLPGMDLATCLANQRDNKKLIANLLTGFYRDYRHIDEMIAAAMQAKDFAEARRLAHSMKSVAGNLVAHELRKAAEELEEGYGQPPDGSNADLPGLLDNFARALPDVVAAARIVTDLKKAQQQGPVDVAKLLEAFVHLGSQIKECNPSSLNLWEPLKPQLESLPDIAAQVEALDSCLDRYDFGNADNHLEELKIVLNGML